ncbi:E3 ubiquitin/ISG15 ligase TRIM25-like [Chanos chanos]|uniref:E3 ubiquitin/ISG15 ligase TRIM25-like n=1 Tax=Chanos chanos TaxID=29144 RepID=A0A6J2VL63_CHACN|nr:E3 ubiquitin/ISG15 ligase TRIM25-like [Chanos chanos]
MAEAGDNVNLDLFSCSICLDPLKDPVTIPCGHSYCMQCIQGYWDQDDQRRVYSCPQCRETFSPKPLLKKNTLMAEMMEKQKMTRPKASPPVQSREYVECDICTDDKNKAVQSCLQCLASFCESHIQPHYESPAFRRHKLVSASTHLQENICQRHGKLLEVYCKDDQKYLCYVCLTDGHKGHDTTSAASKWAEKQEELKEVQRKCLHRIQEREKEIKNLKEATETLKSSAQAAVEDSERIFTEMIHSIERRRCELTEMIRAQERAELSVVEEQMEKVEEEIAALRRSNAELEQLLHTEHPILFLQNFQLMSKLPVDGDVTGIKTESRVSFENVKKTLSEMKTQVEFLLQCDTVKTTREVEKVHTAPHTEPTTREELLLYSCELTLDPNTAHEKLLLTEKNRKVTDTEHAQLYPDHPDRFGRYYHVLCTDGLSGRCYWEAECRGQDWSVAVAYKSMKRKGSGNECRLGYNDKSWRLSRYLSRYYFAHSGIETEIPVPSSCRIGVYLDHSEGILAFYSVSDTMTRLRRVQTTFTEPLYPAFGLSGKSTITICELK